MKKFTFLIATILALASTDVVQANGLGFSFGFRQQVVVRSRIVVQRQVIVQPFVQRQVFVQPYVQQVCFGFNTGYGQQLNVVGDGFGGCGVQAFSAAYGVQAVILRSRVCGN